MEKLELEKFGVLDLNEIDCSQTNGGTIPWALWGAAAAAAIAVYDGATDFVKGFEKGFNHK